MAKTEMITMAGAAPWQLDFTKVEERCDYLLTSGLWADCTFVVGLETHQEWVLGHKLILSMASPVFEAMFFGALSERLEILVPDIQPDAFRALLAYIYTGKTIICSLNLAWELWYAAKKYQLPHLVDECKNYIRSVVDPENACKAYEMARFLEDKSLMDLCIQKITTNTKEAINNSSFDDVELSTVITVCSLEPLNVDSELDLFHAVARYAKAQERTQEHGICPSLDVGVQVNFCNMVVTPSVAVGPPSPTAGSPSTTVGPPSEKSPLSPASPTPKEKVNGEIESSAQNTTVAVELDSKSNDDTDEQSEPMETNKKKVQVPEKPNIRAAIQKIRFLSLKPEQFADGPARSNLLSEAESFAILMNITSKVGAVPMPAGFSNSRVRRQKPAPPAVAPAAVAPAAVAPAAVAPAAVAPAAVAPAAAAPANRRRNNNIYG